MRLPNVGMSSPGTTPRPTTRKPIGAVCSKCGVVKTTGTLSCCARGGDWFNNCGNVGDSKFDHTWAEGTKACDGKCITTWV